VKLAFALILLLAVPAFPAIDVMPVPAPCPECAQYPRIRHTSPHKWRVSCPRSCWRGPLKPSRLLAVNAWNDALSR